MRLRRWMLVVFAALAVVALAFAASIIVGRPADYTLMDVSSVTLLSPVDNMYVVPDIGLVAVCGGGGGGVRPFGDERVMLGGEQLLIFKRSALHPLSSTLVGWIGGRDMRIAEWDSGRVIAQFDLPKDHEMRAIGSDMTGRLLVRVETGYPDSSIDHRLVLVALGSHPMQEVVAPLQPDVRNVLERDCIVSPDANYAWLGKRVFSLVERRMLLDGLEWASYVTFSPDSRRLYTIRDGGRGECWDLSAKRRVWSRSDSDSYCGQVAHVGVSRDGRYLAVACDGILILDAATGKRVKYCRTGRPVYRVQFGSDPHRLFFSAAGDYNLRTAKW